MLNLRKSSIYFYLNLQSYTIFIQMIYLIHYRNDKIFFLGSTLSQYCQKWEIYIVIVREIRSL